MWKKQVHLCTYHHFKYVKLKSAAPDQSTIGEHHEGNCVLFKPRISALVCSLLLECVVSTTKELSEAFRKKVVVAYESGMGFKNISKILEINHFTLWKTIYKFQDLKQLPTCPG